MNMIYLGETLDYEDNERNVFLPFVYGNDRSLRREAEALLEESGNHRTTKEALDQSNPEASWSISPETSAQNKLFSTFRLPEC